MSIDTALSPTPRSTVRRLRDRARTDRSELFDVLDGSLVCHLAIVLGGAPIVLPTGFGRVGNILYLHGSTGSMSMRAALEQDVSISVTLLDGLVYARSVMHFSMNYRSAVIHGRCRKVEGDEKIVGLRAIVEHLAPGSWDYAREPNKRELAATVVLAIDLTEASVKARTGGPGDDDADIERGGVWAGVLPLQQHWGDPVHSSDLERAYEVPEHVQQRITMR
ncbi:pyridoxamine 5'-phosphate oxidase family protein [Antrihabitans sp. YC2-6]|uniref:pyridoxamine 5'-phosphate oxidase family protein n=1 Tax=Antrihabitans sp. YC2-6 TaxID=2799498 RepID=UPI0018F62703|nr:pyridoxamine 5'-phosphate oxidase family protein [Antrihabitans sp. YC2-6]MBJ8344116.1 pyridoxamine 5'-phosphate oxidase family protein [Antrihabitans sp. YC2-6]